jgi:hypothetical protein
MNIKVLEELLQKHKSVNPEASYRHAGQFVTCSVTFGYDERTENKTNRELLQSI